MKGKFIKNPQVNVVQIPLVGEINMDHELVLLAQRIDWKSVDKEFSIYYPYMGRRAVPVRKMAGSMIMKQMFRRRASIEPIIGHLKQDHRLLRNYLKDVEGDMINTLLAGATFNMMKVLLRRIGTRIPI